MSRTILLAAAVEGAEGNELPFHAVWFGVITFAIFMSLLAVTFAFRSVHTRH